LRMCGAGSVEPEGNENRRTKGEGEYVVDDSGDSSRVVAPGPRERLHGGRVHTPAARPGARDLRDQSPHGTQDGLRKQPQRGKRGGATCSTRRPSSFAARRWIA